MPKFDAVVFLLDDELEIVSALGLPLRANGFAISVWTSKAKFLNAHDAQPLCREAVSQGDDLWLTRAKICPIHHVARSSKQVAA